MLSYTHNHNNNNNNQNTFYFRASDVISRTNKIRGPTCLQSQQDQENRKQRGSKQCFGGPSPSPPYSEQNLSGGKTCVTWGQGLWLLANIGRFSSQDKVPIALSSGVRTPSPGPQLSFSTQVASLLEVVTQPSGEVKWGPSRWGLPGLGDGGSPGPGS